MIDMGALNEDFDGRIERWTQLTSFMDAFTRSVLSSLRFTQPPANFVKSNTEKPSEEWRLTANSKEIPPPELSNAWSPPSSLPLLGVDDVRKEH